MKKLFILTVFLSFLIGEELDINSIFSDNEPIVINAGDAKEKPRKSLDEISSDLDQKMNDVFSVVKHSDDVTIEEFPDAVAKDIKNTTNNIQKTFTNNTNDNEEIIEPDFLKKNKDKEVAVKIEGIAYEPELRWFSILDHNSTTFENYLSSKALTNYTLLNIKDKFNNQLAIITNAYAYDYGAGDPEMAEFFYSKFTKKYPMHAKLRAADFYLRTGRPQNIPNILDAADCLANASTASVCDYYHGVYRYLVFGNHKNAYLRAAKTNIKKAKLIYEQ